MKLEEFRLDASDETFMIPEEKLVTGYIRNE